MMPFDMSITNAIGYTLIHALWLQVRLGWHDAAIYDENIKEWPQRGGANGRLVNALKLVQPIEDKYPGVTYADLFQLASATAVVDIKEKRDENLLVLPADAALFDDPYFKVYVEKHVEDQDAFFKGYAEAHAKLSNLGAKFDPPEACH
ncbi:uncharacterized protein A4U43_C09F6720 [Asparagus officinalis]|uniref:Plant heme peroxidase family profile domain-containing protein n=1 Tax=Asparagus officinalis TaxID=4686 RepID=A0A5P1E5U4_ASPOF|nr:uncharacterized protein A4U43_C09F6720 [Asparagus officinalis]